MQEGQIMRESKLSERSLIVLGYIETGMPAGVFHVLDRIPGDVQDKIFSMTSRRRRINNLHSDIRRLMDHDKLKETKGRYYKIKN